MMRSNKFKMKLRSGNGKWNAPTSYSFEQEEKTDNHPYLGRSLYDTAESFEWTRTFGIKALSPEEKLKILQEEIRVRIKITKSEIFKIGELLVYAKKVCQQEGQKFQEWIQDNFDFSYETANNFMNVYMHCLGVRTLALKLSPSILYQISAPSFPDELRKHLFDSEKLNEMTNGKLREITRKYKEGGFDAIKDDIEELNRENLIEKQSFYSLDLVENAIRTLEDSRENIETRGNTFRFLPFDDQSKTDEPEAFAVNSKLLKSIQTAIDLLEKARQESLDILETARERLNKICGIVEESPASKKNTVSNKRKADM